MVVSDGITNDDLFKSKGGPCRAYCLSGKVNSVLCVQCDKFIHGNCTGLKNVTLQFF